MVSLIWKYYSVPVAVVPSKWITPLDRLVAFPTRVAGKSFLDDTGRIWLGLCRGMWQKITGIPGV